MCHCGIRILGAIGVHAQLTRMGHQGFSAGS
jgi:hypothetical protein